MVFTFAKVRIWSTRMGPTHYLRFGPEARLAQVPIGSLIVAVQVLGCLALAMTSAAVLVKALLALAGPALAGHAALAHDLLALADLALIGSALLVGTHLVVSDPALVDS